MKCCERLEKKIEECFDQVMGKSIARLYITLVLLGCACNTCWKVIEYECSKMVWLFSV
jgi:hypothetical protein